MGQGNKPRLYVALYARGVNTIKMQGGEDKYHWSLLMGPKGEGDNTTGRRMHVKQSHYDANQQMIWQYEDKTSTTIATPMLLVRITVAKVIDVNRLRHVLSQVPVRSNEPGWNCVYWVREALEMIRQDGKCVGTSVLDWNTIRNAAMGYCTDKANANRFNGNEPGKFNMKYAATYDLLEGREVIP